MYSAMTNNIQVDVEPQFLEQESDPDSNRYFWAYTIAISNHGGLSVQLLERFWRITDEAGKVEEVAGPGVVGEQPILSPGDTFQYTSGCPLSTPSGIMIGRYRMVTEDGDAFDVDIPAFSLDMPDAVRTVN